MSSLFEQRAEKARRYLRIRPTALALPLVRSLSHRSIVEVDGLRLFLDPTSHLGQTIYKDGTYEPETAAIIRRYVRPDDTILDIGANEGVFSALAATLAGPGGFVMAVEPQSRLQDILAINLALNGGAASAIYHNAVGEEDGSLARISLFPTSNTGASSIVRSYTFSKATEEVCMITPTAILEHSKRSSIDFIKIDVEGYEPEVVNSLIPIMKAGKVRRILLDYHDYILRRRNITPQVVHQRIVDCGYNTSDNHLSGYALYELS